MTTPAGLENRTRPQPERGRTWREKIVIGECGHANKGLSSVLADRVIPYEYQVPRESCYVTLRDIVAAGA